MPKRGEKKEQSRVKEKGTLIPKDLSEIWTRDSEWD